MKSHNIELGLRTITKDEHGCILRDSNFNSNKNAESSIQAGDKTFPMRSPVKTLFDGLDNSFRNNAGVLPKLKAVHTNGSDWEEKTTVAPWGDRGDFNPVEYQGKLWVIGGSDGTTYYNDVWSSEDGENWREVLANDATPPGTQFPQRRGHQVYSFDDKLWVVGGYTGAAYLNDVWNSTDGITWANNLADTGSPGADQFSRRSYFTGCVFNDRMWVIAGTTGTLTNEVWSTADGTDWDNEGASAHFTARQLLVCTIFNNEMFIFGGHDGSPTNDVWSSVDGASWTDESATSQFSARSGLSAVTVDGKMWVFGGTTGTIADTANAQNDVWWSVNGSVWTQGGKSGFWKSRTRQGAVAFKNQIYLMGGVASTNVNDVWSSKDTFNNNAWDEVDDSADWVGRNGHRSVVFQNKMWIIGGWNDIADYNGVYSSPDGTAWSTVLSEGHGQFTARRQHTLLVYDNKMWIIGGFIDPATSLNDVYSSPDGVTWTQETASAAFSARSGHASLVYDNKMWVLGGSDGARKNDVYWSTDGSTWNTATISAGWSGRVISSGIVFDNKMWLIGGDDGSAKSDVWSSSDGVTWIEETPDGAFGGSFGSICTTFNNRIFIVAAAGDSDSVWSSSNGKDWTKDESDAEWVGRWYHNVLTFKNKIWILGGKNGSGNLNDVWSWNPYPTTTGITLGSGTFGSSWSEILADDATPPSTQFNQRECSSLVFNNKLWIIGGFDSTNYFNDVWSSSDGINWTEVLADGHGQWSQRRLHQISVFDNKMWVFGGTTNISELNDVYSSYDGVTWTQTTAAAEWPIRSSFSSLVFDNKMWVMGGYSSTVNRNDVYSSSDGITWNEETSSADWDARRGHTTLVFDNRMWVFGGYGSGTTYNVWSSSDGINWVEEASAIWMGRRYVGSCVFNNKMYVSCGYTTASLDDVWSSEDGINWSEVSSSLGIGTRYVIGMSVFDNKLWIMGGITDSSNLNDVWATNITTTAVDPTDTALEDIQNNGTDKLTYGNCEVVPFGTATLSGASWTEKTASAAWSTRRGHASVVFDNKMWVIGGWNGTQFFNGVYSSLDGINWVTVLPNGHGGTEQWSQRSNTRVVVFDNKMWLVGGRTGPAYLNDVYSSTDGVTWALATSNAGWDLRVSNTLVVFDNKMWVIGGLDSSMVYRNDVWSSSDGISWVEETPSANWGSRYEHVSVVFDNKMWVIGGYAGTYIPDVWCSGDGINWSEVADGCDFRPFSPVGLVANNKIFLLGGSSAEDSGDASNDIWYSEDGESWSKILVSTIWSGRVYFSGVFYDNKMLMFGGIGSSYLNDVWCAEDVLSIGVKRKLKNNCDSDLVIAESGITLTDTIESANQVCVRDAVATTIMPNRELTMTYKINATIDNTSPILTFNENFFKALQAAMQNEPVELNHTNTYTNIVNPFSLSNGASILGGAGVHKEGLVVGTQANPVYNEHDLGIESSLTYSAHTYTPPTINGSKTQIVISRDITNETGSDFGINCFALKILTDTFPYSEYSIIQGDLNETLLKNQVLTITLTISADTA